MKTRKESRRTKTGRRRAFVLGVLDEIENAHIGTLREHRVAHASKSEDLKEWAYRATESRTRKRNVASKGWTSTERLELYLSLFRSASALRDVVAVRKVIASGNPSHVDAFYWLMCLCAERGESLKALFTGKGAVVARAEGREKASENYWRRYYALLPKAVALRGEEPFASMKRWTTAVAERVIKGLSSTEWNALTARGKGKVQATRTENAVKERSRKFAVCLRAWERVDASEYDASDSADYFSELDPVRLEIMRRQMRGIGGFVSRRRMRSQAV